MENNLNKKVLSSKKKNNKTYDDTEDREIAWIAHEKLKENIFVKIVFCVLLVMIGVVLGQTALPKISTSKS